MAVAAKRMAELTDGLPSKSEKMRVLAKAGYSRGDIARFLGTSYQFVRNVLIQAEARSDKAAAKASPPLAPSTQASSGASKVRLSADGQIAIPPAVRKALGLKAGQTLFLTMGDGEIRLLTVSAAVRNAQALVRRFVPEGVSLVDELLEDRRREAERELRNG